MSGDIFSSGGPYYRVRQGFSLRSAVRKFSPRYGLFGPGGKGGSARLILFDTFDGRLFRKKIAPAAHGGQIIFLDKEGTVEEMPFIIEEHQLNPCLDLTALPEGRMTERYKEAAGGRAVLPSAVINSRGTEYEIRGEDGSPAARVFRSTFTGTGTLRILEIVPIPGREKEAAELGGFFEATCSRIGSLVKELIRVSKPLPGRKSFRKRLDLAPEMTISSAFSEIFKYYTSLLSECIPGIRGRWDTEFLHDYRVFLRRLRAVLSAGGTVFPVSFIEDLKHRIKDLAAPTGRPRDLDVMIQHEEEYRKTLPEELWEGLDIFFRRLSEECGEAYTDIARLLSRGRYRAALKALKELSVPGGFPPPLDAFKDRAIGDIAADWITHHVKKVQNSAAKVGTSGQRKALHSLRIRCKVLRYLLEAFGPLCPPGRMKRLLRRLKRFQDTLGCFQDIAIQRKLLSAALDRMRGTEREKLMAAAAIGGILAELARRESPLFKDIRSEAAKLKKYLARD